MPFEDYVLKDDIPSIADTFHKCMAGEPCSYELHLIDSRHEVRTIFINNSPIFIGGNIEGMVSFGHDITSRIKVEEALKESEARYKSFVSQVSEGVYRYEMRLPMSVDIPLADQVEFLCSNMILAECNSTFEEMYRDGGTEELMGKSQRELHKRRDDTTNREVIERFINSGYRLVNFITSETDENGHTRYFSMNALGIVENGHFIRMWGTQTDITERKKAEKDLIAAKVKAEEMNRLKSNFLANMSHELRTPLNGILGFAEILSIDLENPEHAIMAISIQESGKRLSETLNLILDLSKAETENFKVSTSKVNIVTLIKKSAELYQNLAEKKNLLLKTDIRDSALVVNLDGNLFLQVMKNIIDNAIKYSYKGVVTIEAGKAYEDGCNQAIIRVKDEGIGIPEDKLDIIWEEFRQVSEGMNRGFEGLGLGLTISKKIVELMNGSISVESKLGEGSVFTVKFNLAELSPEEEEISTDNEYNKMQIKIEKPQNGICNVLYVEDDFTNQTVARMYLKDICNLDVANNGESALKLVNEKQYNAILMDINLGAGMDGLEVTKEIRKIERYKCVPIIAVTAFAMSSDEDEFLKGGCTHYISKPFEREQFVSLVEKVLEIK
jgi:PAS domain S-box-containing protein